MTEDYKPGAGAPSITPPPELVQQWMDEFWGGPGAQVSSEEEFMAKRAATWGYRQALLALAAELEGTSVSENV